MLKSNKASLCQTVVVLSFLFPGLFLLIGPMAQPRELTTALVGTWKLESSDAPTDAFMTIFYVFKEGNELTIRTVWDPSRMPSDMKAVMGKSANEPKVEVCRWNWTGANSLEVHQPDTDGPEKWSDVRIEGDILTASIQLGGKFSELGSQYEKFRRQRPNFPRQAPSPTPSPNLSSLHQSASSQVQPSETEKGNSLPPTNTPNGTSSPCANSKNTVELNDCWDNQYKQADAELNRVYKQLMSRLSDEERRKLREAQRAWIPYKEKKGEAAASEYEGGSFAGVARLIALTEETRRRTDEMVKQYMTDN